MSEKPKIEILDVGPRDGLQNETIIFTTKQKVEIIKKLINSGIKRLEVVSFVNPKLVPQMADAEAVISSLEERSDITYIGLILNEKGLVRALETKKTGNGIDEIGCVAVSSDSFGLKNQNQTTKESVNLASSLIKEAQNFGIQAQVTISAAFGCPYEGEIPQNKVIDIAKKLAENDPIEIALADTIGAAVPNQVEDVFGLIREELPHIPLRGHFHNTRSTGIANSWAAVKAGAKTIDASIGGLGGCPFAPKATGNVATEDIVFMFERANISTGVNLESLIKSAQWLSEVLNRETPGMVSKAGSFPKC